MKVSFPSCWTHARYIDNTPDLKVTFSHEHIAGYYWNAVIDQQENEMYYQNAKLSL